MKILFYLMLFVISLSTIYLYQKNHFTEERLNRKLVLESDSSLIIFKKLIGDDTLKIMVLHKDKLGVGDGFINETVFMHPKIYFAENLLFEEKQNDGFYLDSLRIKQVSISKNIFYLLLEIEDPVVGNKFLIFHFKDNNLLNIYNAYTEIYSDIDSDGKIEVGGSGLRENTDKLEEYLTRNAKIYELDTIFLIDSIATRKYIESY